MIASLVGIGKVLVPVVAHSLGGNKSGSRAESKMLNKESPLWFRRFWELLPGVTNGVSWPLLVTGTGEGVCCLCWRLKGLPGLSAGLSVLSLPGLLGLGLLGHPSRPPLPPPPA